MGNKSKGRGRKRKRVYRGNQHKLQEVSQEVRAEEIAVVEENEPRDAGPALDIQHSPVRVYLAHAGQPGQAGSDHPAEKQPKSLLKTQENRKANLLPEIV